MNKRLVGIAGIAIIILMAVLVSCAPAAGRATVQFDAQAEELIGAIAEIGLTIQPGSAYNFFSINSIGERFITLQATTTSGFSFFFGGSSIILNFSAQQNGAIAILAASSNGGAAGDESINQIIEQLTVRFDRIR